MINSGALLRSSELMRIVAVQEGGAGIDLLDPDQVRELHTRHEMQKSNYGQQMSSFNHRSSMGALLVGLRFAVDIKIRVKNYR